MPLTMNAVTDEGEFQFQRIHDPGNPIVGAWGYETDTGSGVLVLLADGTFMQAEEGTAGGGGHPGIEAGTWSWNSNTGALSWTVTTDTNGEWGVSHVPAGATAHVMGDEMTIDVPGEGESFFERAPDNLIEGAWTVPDAGEAGGLVVFVFVDGMYFMAQDGSSVLDPSGQDGFEIGTYTWNSFTGAFTHATLFDTNGQWGLSHGSVTAMYLDTAASGTDGNDTVTGGAGDDTLSGGDGNDTITAGAGNDSLDGGRGNDILDGGTGADTMRGGEGDDTYFVDDFGDIVIEPDSLAQAQPGVGAQVSVGGGIDRVVASINFTLSSALENLTLAAGAGNLSAQGNGLANVLQGNEGHNEFIGGAGNDTIDGGAGIDTAFYSGDRAAYTFTSAQVTANEGSDGTDAIANVERLAFHDIKVALDVTGDGHGAIVAKILGAVFGAESLDNEVYASIGLGLVDGGMSYGSLMQLALDVRLGASPTNEEVVTLLYTNVMGGAPDTATRDGFVDWIEAGWYTQGSLAVLAADFMGVPEAAQGGLEYA